MPIKTKRRVLIKLGNNCNLSCSYCHASKNLEYTYNPKIIDFIKKEQFDKVAFGGGEPLLYFDTIKKIIERINQKDMHYKFSTNGFLITDTIVDFCNAHNIGVQLSFDGYATGRCYPNDEQLSIFAKLNNKSINTVLWSANADIEQLEIECREFGEKIGLELKHILPSFMHQTAVNGENLKRADRELAKVYIQYYNRSMESYIYRFLQGHHFDRGMMMKFGELYNSNLYMHGTMCCNENNLMMTVSGDFLLCPYGSIKVGNIYSGVDWEVVENYIPARCKRCSLRSKCGCSCVSNVTDNECYIYKNTYNHFLKVCDKYNITPQDLKAKIKQVFVDKQ